jgi:hypothetical protein
VTTFTVLHWSSNEKRKILSGDRPRIPLSQPKYVCTLTSEMHILISQGLPDSINAQRPISRRPPIRNRTKPQVALSRRRHPQDIRDVKKLTTTIRSLTNIATEWLAILLRIQEVLLPSSGNRMAIVIFSWSSFARPDKCSTKP